MDRCSSSGEKSQRRERVRRERVREERVKGERVRAERVREERVRAERVSRKKIKAREKVEKSNHCVFPMFWGSKGLKIRLAKAAGWSHLAG